MIRNMGGNMLYKNVILIITSVLTLIMVAFNSDLYYKHKSEDYLNIKENIKEYDGSDTIDISKDVKIENIDYLYFDGEGSVFTGSGWMYKTIYIESLIKDENRPSKIAEFVITYKGQRLNFDYEISVADGVILTGDKLAKFRITPKDENIQGTLDFELSTQKALESFYTKKSLPIFISIALGADLIICIIFAVIDGITEKGFFNFNFDLPEFHLPDFNFDLDFCRGRGKPLSQEELEEREKIHREIEEKREKRRKEEARLAEIERRLERIKSYEEKYDLTKPENIVFKELAYDTIFKLFPDENDYKKPKLSSESNNTDSSESSNTNKE